MEARGCPPRRRPAREGRGWEGGLRPARDGGGFSWLCARCQLLPARRAARRGPAAGRRLALPPSRAGAAPASAASPQAPGSLSCCGFHRTGERGAPWKGRHSGGNKRKNDENERQRAGGRPPRRGPGGGGERGAGRVTCHRSSWECEVQPWRPAVCTCGRGLSRRGRVRGGRTALGFGEVAPLPAGAPSAVPAPARSVTGRAVPLPVPAGRSPPVQTTHREPRPFGEIST